MVVGRENVRGEMIVELAKVLEEAMIEVIQRAPRPL
jgi:histone H3/H4